MFDWALVFLAVVALATPASATTPTATPKPATVVVAGGLDPTFGIGGRATGIPGLEITLTDIALQTGGKIVGVGNEMGSGGIVVLRWDDSGHLDVSFADHGIAKIPLAKGGFGAALTVTALGEIVVGGSAFRPDRSGSDLAVFRLTPDGFLDTTFAGGGFTTDLGPVTRVGSVIARDDRRLVIVGDTGTGNIALPRGALVLVGLRGDGTLDSDFGDAGLARFESLQLDRWSVTNAVQAPNGDLVAAASVDTDIFGSEQIHVVRFDHDGHDPQSFQVTPGFASGIARQSSGKLIVNAFIRGEDVRTGFGALVRFDTDGTLDGSFGEDGIREETEIGALGNAIAVDAEDRILLAGDIVARHGADGALDRNFGDDGVATGVPPEGLRAVVIQPDGKIVAAGGICEHGVPPLVFCALGLIRYEGDHTQTCGDADDNSQVTVTDGVATLRRAAGIASLCSAAICDVDGSGSVTVTDGVHVLRAAAGLPATLTCDADRQTSSRGGAAEP